jgi:lipid A disaccharide synthetase
MFGSITFEKFTKENNLTNQPIIALLPGSRKQEIEKMLYHLESIIINKDIMDYQHDDDFWDVTPYDSEDLPF